MDVSLIIPAFIAGLLTFLAPCTLPLVPAYLGFISGVSVEELQSRERAPLVRKKVFFNGLWYVIGFSFVFVALGVVFGLAGNVLAQHRIWLSRIGGIFVIIFGLYMLGAFKLPFLNFFEAEHRFSAVKWLKPGRITSSFIFGATFAFGWTPCIGPVLGSVLLLATTASTVWPGGLLLTIFSFGLAIPFLLMAWGAGSVLHALQSVKKYYRIISYAGGVFLIIIGVMLLTNNFGDWIAFFFRLFDFIRYDALLKYM